MIQPVVERVMEFDVENLCNATYGERSVDRANRRNGYRERLWETHAGAVNVKIPKLRQRSYFPPFLEPRRTAEKALVAVIHQAYVQGVSTGASTPSSIGRIVSKAVIIAVAVNTEGVREVLGSTWQRCRVHFLRNALAHADKGQRQMVLAAINTAFAQESFEIATERWRVVADQLRVKFPALAQLMDVAEADVLAFMSFPKAHRARIHSTSLLERLNAEIKRRTNVVGIFPNAGVVTRLVGAHCSNGTTSGS